MLKAHPATLVLASFLLAIGTGTLLLNLPFSGKAGHGPWVDALVTATSAVCVTGLVVVDTNGHFTVFGQRLILALIQFAPPREFIGKSLKDLNLWAKHNVHITAIHEIVLENFLLVPPASFVIKDSEILIMLGNSENIERIKASKYNRNLRIRNTLRPETSEIWCIISNHELFSDEKE